MKIENCKLKIREREGQLLIELLIALFVGGMFILGATLGVTSIVRYSFETKGNQIASGFGNDLLNDVKSLTDTEWHNLYDLSKGTTYHYYLSQRASSSVTIGGDESMLDNDVRANLIGQWKFDEDTGTTTYDSSGNGNDGTLTNAPTRVNPSGCVVGSCLQFNGSNYVDVPFSQSLNIGSGSWSIAGWVNTTQATWGSLFDGYNGYGIILYGASYAGTARVEFATGSCSSLQAGPIVNNGTWHYITAVRDLLASSLILYVDGVQVVANSSCLGTTSATNQSWDIGRGNRGIEYLNGSVDDVRVYSRALTSGEISKLYNSSVYTRYFSVENVNRDTNGNIASSGGTDDPSTQKITATVSWEGGRQIQLFRYMFRRDSLILWNNDWSGGSGVSGPVTTATSSFASSSNIVYNTPALITVNSTSSTGWLESATFDTQVAGGGTVNSVLWQGTQPAGTSVQFQLAGSSNSAGPWNYIGYDGSGSTYFSPASANVSVSVTNFNNFRYFRYKLFLNPYGNSGPTVTDAIVNWSR